MSGETISHALEHISDTALESAMDVYTRKQKRRSIRRIAAIAAVIAILMTALLWLDGSGNPTPYFSVYVYANETEGVELTIDKIESFPNYDPSKDSTYRPIFNSYVGLGPQSNPFENMFNIRVKLDDQTQEYDNLLIFFDGKKMEPSLSNGMLVGFCYDPTSGQKSLSIYAEVKSITTVDLVLTTDAGDILQHYSMKVTPTSEGYEIFLEKAYITAHGDPVFLRLK